MVQAPDISKALLVAGVLTGPSSASIRNACSVDTFSSSVPEILGVEVNAIAASFVKGHKGIVFMGRPEGSLLDPDGVDICNVTVSYTHPGHGDRVSLHVYLPTSGYNGRFVGNGGGGWASGEIGAEVMAGLASQGYAVASTDGGYDHDHFGTADPWLMKSPGNLEYPLIVNFAHRSLHELAVLGQHVATQGYGAKPEFSYWHGCSTGGRQGLTIANKYPEDFDGVLASCVGVDYPSLALTLYWPQFVMNQRDVYPHACEFEYLAEEVIKACDELDGDKDGIVTRPGLCKPALDSLVGRAIDCGGKTLQVLQGTIEVYKAILKGPVDLEGNELAGGINPGTSPLGFLGIANTLCDEDNHCSRGVPFTIATDWIRLMFKKDPSFDPTTLTHEEFARMFRDARREWGHLFGSSWPDLDNFRRMGKKMISWNGAGDEIIPLSHMRKFYDDALAADKRQGIATSDYYRHFEVPGASHCRSSEGSEFPLYALETLRRWVEDGVAPDELPTVILGGSKELNAKARKPVCSYPKFPVSKEGPFICTGNNVLNSGRAEHQKDEL